MSRQLSISVDIDAPVERVYEVMIDVERWHEWTPSIREVRRLDPGPLRLGAQARIRQPKFPPALWTVTDIVEGRSFTWVSTGPGLAVSGHHLVAPAAGGSRATLAVEFEGVLGGLWAGLTGGITKRYIAMEAAGLKARAEGRA